MFVFGLDWLSSDAQQPRVEAAHLPLLPLLQAKVWLCPVEGHPPGPPGLDPELVALWGPSFTETPVSGAWDLPAFPAPPRPGSRRPDSRVLHRPLGTGRHLSVPPPLPPLRAPPPWAAGAPGGAFFVSPVPVLRSTPRPSSFLCLCHKRGGGIVQWARAAVRSSTGLRSSRVWSPESGLCGPEPH